MITPNKTALTIRIVFIIPSVPKESLIKIVEIINRVANNSIEFIRKKEGK
jgi:hypothetical protein